MYTWTDGAYLMHHGIKGQKWGVRRYQNRDGSYTRLGKKRRNTIEGAYEYANKKAKEYRKSLEETLAEDPLAEYNKRYSGPDAVNHLMEDQFGADANDEGYLRDVFGIDNIEEYAREEIEQGRAWFKEMHDYDVQYLTQESEKYEALSMKYLEALDDVGKLSNKEYREAKRYNKMNKKSR